jgi:hypothetical protein
VFTICQGFEGKLLIFSIAFWGYNIFSVAFAPDAKQKAAQSGRSIREEFAMQPNLSDLLLAVTGIVLSLVFTYVPKLKEWWAARESAQAPIMLGVIFLVSAAYFGLACTALAAKIGIVIPCTTDGAITVGLAFIKIVVANQATYLLTKK